MKQESYLLEEIKVVYKPQVKKDVKITSSAEVANYLRPVFGEDIQYFESFVVLYLNQSNNVLGWRRISTGGLSATLADTRMILQTALLVNATGMILSHNHPSGNLKPSTSDMSLTRKIVQAAKVMDIAVLDHIIMTAESYTSFADDGRLPS